MSGNDWIVGNPSNDSTVPAPPRNGGGQDRTPAMSQPFPYRVPLDLIQNAENPWWLLQETLRRGGPYDFPGFLWQPHFPVQILVPDDETTQVTNPRLEQFFERSRPRIRDHRWNRQATQREEYRLTPEEQKKALKKLKKQLYNPPSSNKSKSKKWCLFNKDGQAANNGNKKDNCNEDGKRCTICLEDFVPKQEVIFTPCNHMFHNDCIVPWVKNHGLCPVCRFVLVERSREEDNGNIELNELITDDVISLIRAMEEAIEQMNFRQ